MAIWKISVQFVFVNCNSNDNGAMEKESEVGGVASLANFEGVNWERERSNKKKHQLRGHDLNFPLIVGFNINENETCSLNNFVD